MTNDESTSPPPGKQRYKRSRRLILPRMQWTVIGGFVAISSIALLMQAAFLTATLASLAANVPTGGSLLEAAIPGFVIKSLAFSFLALLPLTIAVGVSITFRVAGPMYRFEQWLKAIERGEDPGQCRIRKGDHLHGFCATLNGAVDRLREERAPSSQPDRKAA